MITKKDFENAEAIEQDKQNFITYALNKSNLDLLIILDFIEHYENLKSFEYNLKKLKGGINKNGG